MFCRMLKNIFDVQRFISQLLVIGCNEPYTYYDSIFGGHFLDVMTCKKCQKVKVLSFESN